MATIWSRTVGPNGPSISIVFSDGNVSNVNKEHPSLVEITQLLANDAPEEEIKALIDPVKKIAERLNRLSERITTDGVNIYCDGDVIHDTLSDYILSLIRLEAAGEEAPSWKPFVLFLEKLTQNPSQEAREGLYDFIQRWGLTIRPDGDFIAYKGILSDFTSKQSGPGIVNDVRLNGHLPNNPGNRVEIERSYVNADRNNACAQGLHAGTHEYASWWGEKVVAVAINPRDVVSVPRNEVSKLRVCRYEVILEVEKVAPVATAGSASAPVWEPAKLEVNKKFLKRLKKALKNGEFLAIDYKGKSYVAKPREINNGLVKVALDDKKSYRSFYLHKLEKVSKIAPAPEKSTTEVALEEAIAGGKLVQLVITAKKKRTITVKPRRIYDDSVGVTVPSKKNAFEKIELSSIKSVITPE